ncbi:MAG: thioredoxin domain-containing protein [Myxococcales bacterium]|nr:thioredoxin domain-containing protein [Myxococcales bacterium]
MTEETQQESKASTQAPAPAPVTTPDETQTRGKRGGAASLVGVVGFAATLALGYFAGTWIRDNYGDEIRAWASDAPAPKSEDRYNVALRGDEPSIGPADAPITIIEFSDFQCPYCSRAAPDLKSAVDSFGDEVRVIFKQLPLRMHSQAVPAARAALAAHRQGKFWEMHDKLFGNQRALSDENFAVWAGELGLDVAQFKKDYADKAIATQVDQDYAAGSRVGCTGTPCFVVNGLPYPGALPAAAWKKIIKKELDHVDDLGVARGEAYAAIMKDAKESIANGRVGDLPSTWKDRAARPGGPDPLKRYKVLADDRPQKGPDDALVTIVEFSDFQCPFCEKVTPTLKELSEKYGADLRIVFRNNPLPMHPAAKPAAIGALAADRQGKFWEMHDLLFANRKALSDDSIRRLAAELGLDMARYDQDVQDPALLERVREDAGLAMRMGANGTPAFFVNGKYLSGAQPLANFSQLIDEELVEARKLVAAGTPRGQVLERLLADAEQSVARPAPQSVQVAPKQPAPPAAEGSAAPSGGDGGAPPAEAGSPPAEAAKDAPEGA